MSTYYATFSVWKQAKAAADELLSGGLSPDDLSLIRCMKCGDGTEEMVERAGNVGDASYHVGRWDDPVPARTRSEHEDVGYLTTISASRISPVDTSDRRTDVDSVDQMDDSQNEAEFMISPRDGISHSTHEVDDLAFAAMTGFPTAPASAGEEPSDPFENGRQGSESVEVIEIPSVGVVIGGGALATAALDFTSCVQPSLLAHLLDEGVPEEAALEYQHAFELGAALIGVAIAPGEVVESSVEEILERHGCQNGELYDAPRY